MNVAIQLLSYYFHTGEISAEQALFGLTPDHEGLVDLVDDDQALELLSEAETPPLSREDTLEDLLTEVVGLAVSIVDLADLITLEGFEGFEPEEILLAIERLMPAMTAEEIALVTIIFNVTV